ncbi:hypothetical protein AHAS_Ahas05G0214700 [Arachis hypogaea]
MLLPEPPRGVARNRCCPASAILRFNIHWPGLAFSPYLCSNCTPYSANFLLNCLFLF